MAQDVKIANITYSDVPAIEIPKATTGTALFTDTSPTTAVASDVASGKYFFTASGQLTLGSASGGTAAISVVDTTDTAGGTIRTITALDISDTTAVASDVASGKYFYTANGTKTAGTASGGGGGLEYEEGTWTPSEDVAEAWISFTNTHTTAPFLYYIIDSGDDFIGTASSNALLIWSSPYLFSGNVIAYNSTGGVDYVLGNYRYYTATALGNGNISESSAANISNWSTSTGIKAYVANTSRYWRAGRTYKWIAVWAPTT